MKKAVAYLAALGLVVAGCGGATAVEVGPDDVQSAAATRVAPTAPTRTTGTKPPPFAVVDVANGQVVIEHRPEAIISLSPTASEMLFAIGAGDQVVAVDEYSNYPAEAPITDLSGFTPNLEAIASYGPDMVVVGNDVDGLVASLNDVGIPTLFLPAAVTFDDVYEQVRDLGVATGNETNAVGLADELSQEIEQLVAEAGPLGAGLRVYHELDPTLYSVTSVTFIGLVYSSFGLENIADSADPDGFGYPQLSAEYILEANPDLIFLTDCCGGDTSTVSERAGWDSIGAVQHGAIAVLDADTASRWGPRLVEFIRVVAQTIIGLHG